MSSIQITPQFRGLDKHNNWQLNNIVESMGDTYYINDVEVKAETISMFTGKYDIKNDPIYDGDSLIDLNGFTGTVYFENYAIKIAELNPADTDIIMIDLDALSLDDYTEDEQDDIMNVDDNMYYDAIYSDSMLLNCRIIGNIHITKDMILSNTSAKNENEAVYINDCKKEDIHPNGFNMNIKLHPSQTMQSLSDNGFTNYDPPTLYYMNLVNPDLNVSIILKVHQETLEITYINIMDEDFMQPYDYQNMLKNNPSLKPAVTIYHDVNKIMHDLQDRNIITGFTEGMYI